MGSNPISGSEFSLVEESVWRADTHDTLGRRRIESVGP
jgi:hypothetical protein